MKRFIPDTIFARLFSLVLFAIVVSHLATFVVLFGFYGNRFAPSHAPDFNMPAPMPPGSVSRLRAPPGLDPWLTSRPPPPPNRPHEFTERDKNRLPPGLWIGLITQIVALTIAAWFGARIITRPIQRQAGAAAQLGATLNSPLMDEESGPMEVRQAAEVFNQMQQRIRTYIEEKERFLAAVSHDLRTPLTRMKLRLDHLADNVQKDKMNADIDEMSLMLDAVLDYMRGQSLNEDMQMLDVQALLDSMVQDAIEQGHDVRLEGTGKPIMTRPLALRRALSNLIENALRYGHRAAISLTDSQETLRIEVRDKGPGIAADKIGTVLEPFVRLEASRNKAYGGVGLGLTIAREAARQCGGELTLRNAEEGGLIAAIAIRRYA